MRQPMRQIALVDARVEFMEIFKEAYRLTDIRFDVAFEEQLYKLYTESWRVSHNILKPISMVHIWKEVCQKHPAAAKQIDERLLYWLILGRDAMFKVGRSERGWNEIQSAQLIYDFLKEHDEDLAEQCYHGILCTIDHEITDHYALDFDTAWYETVLVLLDLDLHNIGGPEFKHSTEDRWQEQKVHLTREEFDKQCQEWAVTYHKKFFCRIGGKLFRSGFFDDRNTAAETNLKQLAGDQLH